MRLFRRLSAILVGSFAFALAASAQVGRPGPGVIFTGVPAASAATIASGFVNSTQIAVDAHGDIFEADNGRGDIEEIPLVNGVYQAPVALTSPQPSTREFNGITIDGAGNLYFTEPGGVGRIPNESGALNPAHATLISLPFSGTAISQHNNLAADAAGNVFVAGGPTIFEILPDGNVIAVAETGQPHVNSFEGITLDPSGNIFFGSEDQGALFEVPNLGNGRYATTSVRVGTAGFPLVGTTSDAAGNIYAIGGGSLIVFPHTSSGVASTPLTVVSGVGGQGLAFDPNVAGRIFYSTSVGVNAFSLGAPPAANLGLEAVGQATPARTITQALSTGNQPENFDSITSSDPQFQLSGCAPAIALAPGAFCSLNAAFAPTVPGVSNASVTWTGSSVTPTEALSGNGIDVATSLVLTTPNSVIAGQPFTLTVIADDAEHRPTQGYTGTVQFLLGDNAAGAVLPADYTFVASENGVHVFDNLTTLEVAGLTTLVVSDNSPSPLGTVTFITVKAAAPAAVQVSGANQAVVVGTRYAPVEATVVDRFGNPVSGATVNFGFPTGALIGPTSLVTDANGNAFASFTAGTTAESFQLTISSPGVPSAPSLPETNLPGPAVALQVALPPFAGPGLALTGTVAAKDLFGNLVADPGPFTFQSSDASAVLPPVSSSTNFTVAFNQPGVQTITASDNNGLTGVAQVAVVVPVFDFGTQAVGRAGSPQTVLFGLPAGTAVAAVTISGDYLGAGTANCAGTNAQASFCAVPVAFSPKFPGLRAGAVVLRDAQGRALQTVYLHGVGQGALAAFPAGAAVLGIASPAAPTAVAQDAAGNTFFVDSANHTVLAMPASGPNAGASLEIFSSPDCCAGLAVDGAGNVFVADNTGITRIPTQNGMPSPAPERVLNYAGFNLGVPAPNAVNILAVDGSGNLYVALGGTIFEVPSSGSSPSPVATAPGATALAFGDSGQLFWVDGVTPAVFAAQIASGTSGIAVPTRFPATDVALDPANDIYYSSSRGIAEITAGNEVALTPDGTAVNAVAEAATGDLLFTSGHLVNILALSQLDASYAVGSAIVGATTPSRLVTQVQSIGNAPLQISAASAAAPFALAGGCSAGQTLNPGNQCALVAQFTPAVTGPSIGTLSLTTTAVFHSAQTATLNGTGIAIPQNITFATPTTLTYGGPVTLRATGGGSGNAVTFSLVSGGNIVGLSGTDNAVLTFSGIGTIQIEADQAAGGNFAAARPVQETITILPAPITIAANNATRQFLAAEPTFTGTVGASVNGDVLGESFTSTDQPGSPVGLYAIIPALTGPHAGNYTVTAVPGVLSITPAFQAITFAPLPDVQDPPTHTITLQAGGGLSGNPVTFTATGPVTQSGTNGEVLTFTGLGVVTVTANQAGNTNFFAAPPVTRTFEVQGLSSAVTLNFNHHRLPAGSVLWFTSRFAARGAAAGTTLQVRHAVITFTANGRSFTVATPDADITYSASATCASTHYDAAQNKWITVLPLSRDRDRDDDRDADASFMTAVPFVVPAGGLPGDLDAVAWSARFGSNNLALELTWQGEAANFRSLPADLNQLDVRAGAGRCDRDDHQPVGMPGVRGGQLPGGSSHSDHDRDDSGSDQARVNFTPQAQTVDFDAPDHMRVGGRGVELRASASSGLPVSFAVVSGPGTLLGAVLTASAPGAIVVEATQPGNGSFLAAPPVRRTIEADGRDRP